LVGQLNENQILAILAKDSIHEHLTVPGAFDVVDISTWSIIYLESSFKEFIFLPFSCEKKLFPLHPQQLGPSSSILRFDSFREERFHAFGYPDPALYATEHSIHCTEWDLP
jgi:hypothetical protein